MGSQQLALCFKTDLIATTHWGLALTVLFIQTQFPHNFGMQYLVNDRHSLRHINGCCQNALWYLAKNIWNLVTKFNTVSLVYMPVEELSGVTCTDSSSVTTTVGLR